MINQLNSIIHPHVDSMLRARCLSSGWPLNRSAIASSPPSRTSGLSELSCGNSFHWAKLRIQVHVDESTSFVTHIATRFIDQGWKLMRTFSVN